MERLDFHLHRIVRPRFVISSAEVLHPTLRERIIRDLKVEVYSFYAAMEVGRIAWECRAHQGLHVNADAMIVESVPDSRARVAGYGTVVVTSLDSFTMPMIRYRLGDLASFIEGACPCGVSFPRIDAPLGRDTDLIVLPSGRMVTPLATGVLMRSLASVVERWRLTQHSPDYFSLSLVPRTPIDPADLDVYKRSFVSWLGEPVRLDIRIVERVPEIGPKTSPFVSEVPGASIAPGD
jgi:phenylacetate-CoA ligase